MIWFQCLLFEIWKIWKKVQNSKKSFWWHDFRTKDDQRGLNKQMVMSMNKKINDKNNSKLKTLQIVNYEVKQSKMMFLFLFVLFKQYSSSTSLNFISSIFDDEYYSLTFVFFYLCIVIIIHILFNLFYCIDLLIKRSDQSVYFRYFWVFFVFVFLFYFFKGFYSTDK